MRGLTDQEREFLRYTRLHGGHHNRPGPKSGHITSSDEPVLMALMERGAIVCIDCPDPCPWSHPHITTLGEEILKIDAVANGEAL